MLPASAGAAPHAGGVLTRVALASGPVSRSAISKGSMLLLPETLASGTVSKAVDALLGKGLLIEEDSQKSGQPGPPITPLRLGDKWAIIGIHIDQQHEGPDGLAGIICGLDRKPLTELVKGTVPRKGDQHDLRRLAEEIRKLTEKLLAQLDGPRKFLGVGVEIGGHVYRGEVEDSVHAGWSQKVDLQRLLTEVLDEIPELGGVPGVAENDVNALAIHGYYEQSFRGLDVVLLAVFRQGVGGALILDGRMYRGIHGMAPEPGHLAVEYPEDNPRGRLRPHRDPGRRQDLRRRVPVQRDRTARNTATSTRWPYPPALKGSSRPSSRTRRSAWKRRPPLPVAFQAEKRSCSPSKQ